MIKGNMVCYLYSKKQRDFNMERARLVGSEYNIGKILAMGKTIEFTEISTDDKIRGVEITHPDIEIVFQISKDEVGNYKVEEPYIG